MSRILQFPRPSTRNVVPKLDIRRRVRYDVQSIVTGTQAQRGRPQLATGPSLDVPILQVVSAQTHILRTGLQSRRPLEYVWLG